MDEFRKLGEKVYAQEIEIAQIDRELQSTHSRKAQGELKLSLEGMRKHLITLNEDRKFIKGLLSTEARRISETSKFTCFLIIVFIGLKFVRVFLYLQAAATLTCLTWNQLQRISGRGRLHSVCLLTATPVIMTT